LKSFARDESALFPEGDSKMTKIVVGLLDSQAEAQKAIEELLKSGFRREDIGTLVMAPGADKIVNNAAKGVFLGSIAGLLIGAATMLIPGIGWVMVAGPVSSVLLGTALGAAAGGVIAALRSKGVPEKDAKFFEEGVRRGGVLITVAAKTDEDARRAEEILKRHGAMDIDARREEWKREGWSEKPAAGKAEKAKGKAPVAAQEQRQQPQAEPVSQSGEAEMPVAAVCVYELVIEAEAPDEETERYAGPERRTGTAAYQGMDRRQAA
jgi:hypothetical protein